MNQDVILCVSNSYEKKYYLNEIFEGLPQRVKDELKILCETKKRKLIDANNHPDKKISDHLPIVFEIMED